ncbi:hypothetical protein Cni_G22231 [Canna indica]|uniref:PHD-type domain-containing protein n=1 Tax=Canna indica TaxID=4628 RepID=A0AAQ3QI21_9LILI|nr:hypothetical protein Cni_G22231 [Canna indica]
MSPKSVEGHWDSFKNTIHNKEENQPPHSEIVVLPGSWMDVSIVNATCLSLEDHKDGYVYKRRKLSGNSVALLPEENMAAKGTKAVTERATVGILTADDESVPNGIYSIGESEVPNNTSNGKSSKSVLQHCYNSNGRCSSSKSNSEHTPTFLDIETDDAGECSSSDVLELAGEFSSARELCIHVLRSHGLLGKPCRSGTCAVLEISCDDINKFSQKCKTCGLLDDPLEMLICDHCDEAYHPSCYKPRVRKNQVKKIPTGEWYCRACFKKKPKPQYNELPVSASDQPTRRKYSISSMLADMKPYTTGARIGKDFQVQVPEWSGPVSNEDSYFEHPHEMDSTASLYLNGWNGKKPQKSCSTGNWVQCREVLISDASEEIICGKWRRYLLAFMSANLTKITLELLGRFGFHSPEYTPGTITVVDELKMC